MKVIAAYKENDLSSLSTMEEPIVFYSNDKKVYDRAVALRGKQTTHAIYDKGFKTAYQVILDYSHVLHENGADNLEVHLLPQKYNYVPFVLIILLILIIIMLTISFVYSVRNRKQN